MQEINLEQGAGPRTLNSPAQGFECGEPQWFAVYTSCRHEKRVAEHLETRAIEYFLPLYRAKRKWRDGSRVTLELPLFPCYLFVRIGRPNRRKVLEVPGALAVVGGTGRNPAPVDPTTISALREGLESNLIEPHPLIAVGQRARIQSGAFSGMEGVVVRRKSGVRIVLAMDCVMQGIAVEVEEGEIEAVVSASLGRALYQ